MVWLSKIGQFHIACGKFPLCISYSVGFLNKIISRMFSPLWAVIGPVIGGLILAVVSIWMEMPQVWRYFYFGALATYVLFSLFISLYFLVENRLLKIEFNPSQGPAPIAVLGVKNLRKARWFRAECTLKVLRNNSGNRLSQRTYAMKWENFNEPWLEIEKNRTENLLIADFDTVNQHDLYEMRLVGLLEGSKHAFEWSR